MSIKSNSIKSNTSIPKRNVRKHSVDGTSGPEIRLSQLGINERSPSDLDLQIQSGRILQVLDKAVEKLIVASCLPCLIAREGHVIKNFMEPTEVEFILNVCWKYVPEQRHLEQVSSTYENMSAIINRISMRETTSVRSKALVKISSSSIKDDHMGDANVAQVIEMLWKNRDLRTRLLLDYHHLIDAPSKMLIDSLRSLRQVINLKLSTTAAEERNHERMLRRAWKLNETLERNIEEANYSLEKQREELGKQLETKNSVVTDYMKKIEDLKEKFKKDIVTLVDEWEQDMADDVQISDLRQTELSAEAKAVTQQYENLLSLNLGQEKSLRAKRFKVETQLSSWLAKFDADIGERQAEFEELTAGYEKEKAEMEELQEKFNEQEEEYIVLMEEKEEEERKIFEERAYVFLTNRSARRIQRYWRAYRQRKIDRKKAKKAKAKAKKEKSAEASGEGGEKQRGAGKKGGGGKDKKGKGKGKGKDKGKTDSSEPREFRGADPMATLEKKFGGEMMEELKGEEFRKEEVVVDLMAEPSGVTDVKLE